MMLELEAQGAININLVTPLHFAPQVRQAVLLSREAGMTLPVVCNTSGYETPEVVRAMGDVVDVWLTDFKFSSGDLACRLNHKREEDTGRSGDTDKVHRYDGNSQKRKQSNKSGESTE